MIKTGDGTTISDPFERANCFNDFVASIYMVANNVIPSIDPRVPDHVSFNCITFTRTNVFKILNKLNAKSAGGLDHFPPILLKNIASSIASPLA